MGKATPSRSSRTASYLAGRAPAYTSYSNDTCQQAATLFPGECLVSPSHPSKPSNQLNTHPSAQRCPAGCCPRCAHAPPQTPQS